MSPCQQEVTGPHEIAAALARIHIHSPSSGPTVKNGRTASAGRGPELERGWWGRGGRHGCAAGRLATDLREMPSIVVNPRGALLRIHLLGGEAGRRLMEPWGRHFTRALPPPWRGAVCSPERLTVRRGRTIYATGPIPQPVERSAAHRAPILAGRGGQGSTPRFESWGNLAMLVRRCSQRVRHLVIEGPPKVQSFEREASEHTSI